MNKELNLDNTTLLVEGKLVKGQTGDHNTMPIADHFEGEKFYIEDYNIFIKSNIRIDITQLINDLAVFIHEHPVTCDCGKKHIFKLNEMIDEKLNQL